MQEKVMFHQMKDTLFEIKEDVDQTLISMVNRNDKYQMNWVAEGKHWGELITPKGIKGSLRRSFSKEGRLVEHYTFVNERDTDYFGQKNEIGILVPLPDNYKSSEICMKERCHAHIWCGGNTTYISALRMGGMEPNLGLVLTHGSILEYSIIRDVKAISNDRGSIVLHPQIDHILPGETAEIEWELFWFQEQEEFNEILTSYENCLQVQLNKGVFFVGEDIEMQINCGSNFTDSSSIEIKKNGVTVPYRKEQKAGRLIVLIRDNGKIPEEQYWQIKIDEHTTFARTLVLPAIDELAGRRCRFIADKQQYHNEKSHLDGAYLIYDMEEQRIHYSEEYDHNGGRERVGMGVLLAAYLQKQKDPRIEKSLEKFTEYVYRELYDEETGIVYNDVNRNNTWHRLYNYPWLSLFFMERYKLYGQTKDLHHMYQIIRTYYEQGGEKFYAIAIPMSESIQLLLDVGWKDAAKELLELYERHGDVIVKTGLRYPAHEVNYEQSIVAPAVSYLMQLYQLTGREKYLIAGKEQLRVLKLFNGHQPDYHMYETAIRHWDGFWFGKRKIYGDTFPHYWSALTGLAFCDYARSTQDGIFEERAEDSLRGVLSMIHSDGSASCAYVYPSQINGTQGSYYDPWANDQDWGLYFYLKEGKCYHEH